MHASNAGGIQGAPTLGASIPSVVELGGRVFLVSLFLISGLGKISGYEATMAYMSANGVPSTLLPLVIGFEVLAAVAVVAITGGFLLLVANGPGRGVSIGAAPGRAAPRIVEL